MCPQFVDQVQPGSHIPTKFSIPFHFPFHIPSHIQSRFPLHIPFHIYIPINIPFNFSKLFPFHFFIPFHFSIPFHSILCHFPFHVPFFQSHSIPHFKIPFRFPFHFPSHIPIPPHPEGLIQRRFKTHTEREGTTNIAGSAVGEKGSDGTRHGGGGWDNSFFIFRGAFVSFRHTAPGTRRVFCLPDGVSFRLKIPTAVITLPTTVALRCT